MNDDVIAIRLAFHFFSLSLYLKGQIVSPFRSCIESNLLVTSYYVRCPFLLGEKEAETQGLMCDLLLI